MIRIYANILIFLNIISISTRISNISARLSFAPNIPPPITQETSDVVSRHLLWGITPRPNFRTAICMRCAGKGGKTILQLTTLLLSGDVQLNPGPQNSTVHPCGYCEERVNWSCDAMGCDECSVWYHRNCISMSASEYERMDNSSVIWVCNKCQAPNYSDSLFNSFYITDTHNSYSILAGAMDDTVFSMPSPTHDYGRPINHSSPRSSKGSYRSSRERSNRTSGTRDTSSTATPGRHDPQQRLRLLVVNCNSCRGKRAELENLLHCTDADLLLLSETKIDNTISPSEFLPPQYCVAARKDRALGGGGVMLVTKTRISACQLDIDVEAETTWATITLRNQQKLYVGTFYRQPKGRVDEAMKKLEGLDQALNQVQDTTRNSNATIILGGDFNAGDINWDNYSVPPGATDPTICEKVLEIVDNHGLTQLQKEPTREDRILDLFCTNKPDLVANMATLPGISDHDIILADCNIRLDLPATRKRKVNIFSKANWDRMKKDTLAFQEDFVQNHHGKSPNENFNSIKVFLQSTVDKNVPSKVLSAKFKPPWLNTSIQRMCRKKQRLFNKAKKNKKQKTWDDYKNFKRSTLKTIRKARQDYLNNILKESLDTKDTKPLWRYIKAQRQDSTGVAPLKSNGKLYSDSASKADILNHQFESVFTKDEPGTENACLNGPELPHINDLVIENAGVEKLLSDINAKKASGPDLIPCRLLKGLAKELSPCFTALFVQSLRTGCLPDDWLNANVAPIFKKGSKNQAVNYRPVSLTSVACKILEHIVAKHIRKHLDDHNVITPYQHGFRQRHSCETQLLTTTHELLRENDKNNQVDVAVLDFSKAFDTVPHARLLGKLSHYGIKGPTLRWIRSFLTNRHQRVVVEGISSSAVEVASGVPQGTVLGPLLFLIYINDLPSNVSSTVRLFADDCLMYRVIKNAKDHLALQKDLDNLHKWGKKWGMRFNTAKCNILRISRTKKPSSFFYTIGGDILREVESAKYLGVTLQNNLHWSQQTAVTSKKANAVLAFLRRNLKGSPKKIKELTYYTMVRPILEYAAPIWDPHLKKDIYKIEQVQRRAARFVTNKYRRRESVTNMLKDLSWDTLEERRKQQRLTLMFKVTKDKVAVSVEDIDLLPTTTSTRGGELKFRQIRASTAIYQHACIPKTIIEWNRLPETTRTLDDIQNFKQNIRD